MVNLFQKGETKIENQKLIIKMADKNIKIRLFEREFI
jgi:hypothetical protein